ADHGGEDVVDDVGVLAGDEVDGLAVHATLPPAPLAPPASEKSNTRLSGLGLSITFRVIDTFTVVRSAPWVTLSARTSFTRGSWSTAWRTIIRMRLRLVWLLSSPISSCNLEP